MSDDVVVFDELGNRLRVGDTVNTGGEIGFEGMALGKRKRITSNWSWPDEASKARHLALNFVRAPDGVIEVITDWDGDVDDGGRVVGIWPKVGVRWPGEEELEYYSTYTLNMDYDVEVSDLILVVNGRPAKKEEYPDGA